MLVTRRRASAESGTDCRADGRARTKGMSASATPIRPASSTIAKASGGGIRHRVAVGDTIARLARPAQPGLST